MISTNSLQAFSAATTQPLDRTASVRLVRSQPEPQAREAAPGPAVAGPRPSLPPPRGTLLNLSI